MNLKSRKIISMALVFFMMLTILPLAPLTAHAAGTLPAPTWSSAEDEKYTIKWNDGDHNAPEVWIALYYSGSSKGFYTTNDGSEDLSSYIKLSGSGDYYVTIQGKNCEAYSAYSATKTFNFANQLSQPTNVRWDGAVATWDPVEGADRYWFNAYNGSEQILPGNYTTETSMDLTDFMLASGSYTFTVQAYSFGDIAASNMVTSPVKEKDATFYPMDVKFGDGITKDRYLLYWDAIPSTNGYWIKVYKDGSLLSGSDGATDIPVTSIDLANIFARHGNGNYTVEVTAHGATYADKTAEDSISINYQPCTVTLSVEPKGAGVVTGKGTFNKGDNIAVTATAITGYEFVKWTEGGETVDSGATYNFQISENRNLVAVFEADSSVAFIDSLEITGLQAPVAGQTPGTPTATFTPAGAFEVTDAKWLESNKGVIYGSFVEGSDYLARFRLTPNAGKAFPADLNKDDITTDLGEVTDVEVLSDATYVYVKIKAEKVTPPDDTKIKAIDITGLQEPVAGTAPGTPSVTFTPNDKFDVTSCFWVDKSSAPLSENFVEGEDYQVVFVLEAKDGEAFDSSVTVTTDKGTVTYTTVEGSNCYIWVKLTAVEAVTSPCEHPNKKYEYNADGHWYVCPDCTDLAKDVKEHEYEDDADTTCKCGYVREIEGGDVTPPECQHPETEVKYDDDGHWTECKAADCDYATEKVPHVFETDEDTTCECGYTRTIETPEPTKYTVKFDSDGGSAVTEQTIEEGGKATKPENPTKEGYTFKGWTLNESAYDFSAEVTGDITLKAVWEVIPAKYTITYTDGVEGKVIFTDKVFENVVDGSDTPVFGDAPTRSGYTFKGWSPAVAEKVTGNQTYTATWQKRSSGGSYVVPDKDADSKLRIVMQINNKNILVNGKTMVNDVAPVIVADRTLVPIRVVTELLGGSAHWDNATRTVTLNIDGKVLSMTIGKEIPGFGTSAVIMNDRTYVPVRYVMEKLGADVEWINATCQIIIEK